MKITPISLYNKSKQIPFKNNPADDEPINPVQVVPTTIPTDTTQFQSAAKKPKTSVLKKIANFFAEPVNPYGGDVLLIPYML